MDSRGTTPDWRRRDRVLSDWVVLTADEAVITTRPVPVERVRLVTEWVTVEQEVQADVPAE